MFLRDQSSTIWDTQQSMNLLYVTPFEMLDGFFIPGPIELTMSIFPKKYRLHFDRYTFLVGYNRFVTKPCVNQNININVDFGEYDIKRR